MRISKQNADDKLEGIVVKIDRISSKTTGLKYYKHTKKGTFWHLKCVEKARDDYFNRYSLELMSECCNYFLFYDNFKEMYNVWKIDNVTNERTKRLLEKGIPEKEEDQMENEKQNGIT